jgi:hypothetical protein
MLLLESILRLFLRLLARFSWFWLAGILDKKQTPQRLICGVW